MARRQRGGRGKQRGDRYECGKLKPQQAATPELVQRRAEAAGCSTEVAMKDQAAGYALGQLMLRGLIDQRQHDAGIAFRSAWMRWASLAGLPPHEVTQRSAGAAPSDVAPEAWQRARDAFYGAVQAIRQCEQCRLVWVAVETVVMDDVLPPMMPMRSVAAEALKRGLTALGDFYKMPKRQAA